MAVGPKLSPEDRLVETVAQLLSMGVDPSLVEIEGNRVRVEVRSVRRSEADRALEGRPAVGSPEWYGSMDRKMRVQERK